MLLAIDIGNTEATIGAIEGAEVSRHWRLSTRAPRTRDELALTLKGCLQLDGLEAGQVEAAVIGSVVTHLTPIYESACERLLGRPPLVVTGHTPMPIRNGYADPGAVGVDRLANAVAGVSRYGAPLIVADFGTAITLDVISADGVYLGGMIAPGPEMMAEALFQGTSRLPHVVVERPPSVIGRTTRDSIASGVFYGVAGAVDSLIERARRELGVPGCKAVATGGRAPAFVEQCRAISACDPFLTLLGLKEIWAFQKPS